MSTDFVMHLLKEEMIDTVLHFAAQVLVMLPCPPCLQTT